MSPKEELRLMRGSNSRRWRSRLQPTNAARPAIPPTTKAAVCLKPWLTPSVSNTLIGVRRPTKWPINRIRMPMWNRLEPQTIWRRRRNWLDCERQLYWLASNLRMEPTTSTVTAR